MANYQRNFLAGGSYFFTVSLADRRLTPLNDHIDLLRAPHPFTIEAAAICMRSGPSQSKTRISSCVGA
jgi:putative transposase